VGRPKASEAFVAPPRSYRPRPVESTAHDDQLARIRSGALELFAVHGYRATTMTMIGAAVGVRGPSLYRYVRSKHDLLRDILLGTTEQLLQEQRAAAQSCTETTLQLRRLAEAHVRFHALHRYEAFVGTREIDNLNPEHRGRVAEMRAEYESTLRSLIQRGVAEGVFSVLSPQLASYAILDMGIGVSGWFHEGAALTADQVAYTYGDLALRLVHAK
jgi:AcrR family transcriptional regulator